MIGRHKFKAVLTLISLFFLSTFNFGDGDFATTQLINLELKLTHSSNGLLTGTQTFQVSFSGRRISDNADVSFNPKTGAIGSTLTLSGTFTNGVGNIAIPVLTEATLSTFGFHQFKDLTVKIALNDSPTDFVEIPFSSSMYAMLSMFAEQLAGNVVTVDTANNLVQIKKIKLVDDNYEINTKSDLVSAGNGLAINANNQVSIAEPPTTPATSPFLKYNITNDTIEWAIIEGVEDATYLADQGIRLDTDTFRIATSNVAGTLATGHFFTWDDVTDEPKWVTLTAEDGIDITQTTIGIGDDIKLGTGAGDTGKIRFNAGTGNFEGFTGTEWEILNSANVTVTIDNSEAIWEREAATNRIKFATGTFQLALGTNDPGTHRLRVNGTTDLQDDLDVGGDITADSITAAASASTFHSVVLTNADTDNTLADFVVRAGDGTLKRRALSSLPSRGLELEGTNLKITDTNADTNDIFRWDGTNPVWVPIVATGGTTVSHAGGNLTLGFTTTRTPGGNLVNDDILAMNGGAPEWDTVSNVLNNKSVTNFTVTTLGTTTITNTNLSSTTVTAATLKQNTTDGDAHINIKNDTGQSAIIVKDGTNTQKVEITNTGQLFTGGLTSITGIGDTGHTFANQGLGYSQHFHSATIRAGLTDAATIAATTDPTLEVRKLAQSNQNPVLKVFETGPEVVYFSVNVDKTLKLFKHTTAPTCGAGQDGHLILKNNYKLCACNGGSSTWVETGDGTTNCFP